MIRSAACFCFVALSIVAPATLAAESPCSDAWYRWVEKQATAGDPQGHGPDRGSDEWKSMIEFKLGVRGKPEVPPRDSDRWCSYIDGLVDAGSPAARAAGQGPSYDCSKSEPGSIEAMICGDAGLSALDRKLADVYAAAGSKAVNEHPPQLKATQRGWIKGRDECWKSADKSRCVHDEYVRRIAELQAAYRLVAAKGPVFFACEGAPANEVVVTFFSTDPPTLIAERGDSTSLMFLQPSASGSRYTGRNETFREHQGEARITWGYNAPEMTCKQRP